MCCSCVCTPPLTIYIQRESAAAAGPLGPAQHKFSFTGGGGGVLLIIRCRAGSFLYQSRINGHPPTPPSPFFFIFPPFVYILDVCLLLYVPSISFHSSLSFLSLFPYPVTGSTPFLFFLLQCAFLSFLFLELDSLYRLTMLLLLLRLLCMLAPLSHFIINGGNIREPTPRSLPGTSSPPLYTQYIIQRVPQPKKWGVEETGLHKK